MERRRVGRRSPAVAEPLSHARLRTGLPLTVIDVSDCGALVEGGRLLPGTHVDVHLVTGAGRVLVRSRVVRAFVTALSGDAVLYRSALAFDRPVDTTEPRQGGWLPQTESIGYGLPAAAAEPAA